MAQKYEDMINTEILILYTTNSVDIYYVLKNQQMLMLCMEI